MYPFKICLVLLLTIGIRITVSAQPVQTGEASYYAKKFEGRLTSNGEVFRQKKLTAAHRKLAFGTYVKVTNLSNQKSVVVRINDRGPFAKGRIIDLSRAAAKKLDFLHHGVTQVKVEVLPDKDIRVTGLEKEKKTLKKIVAEKTASTFYQLKLTRPNTGFGVQIGSYERMENAFVIVKKINQANDYQVGIQESNNGGDALVYKVILTGFDTAQKAQACQQKIQPDYPDSFTINFAKAAKK